MKNIEECFRFLRIFATKCILVGFTPILLVLYVVENQCRIFRCGVEKVRKGRCGMFISMFWRCDDYVVAMRLRLRRGTERWFWRSAVVLSGGFLLFPSCRVGVWRGWQDAVRAQTISTGEGVLPELFLLSISFDVVGHALFELVSSRWQMSVRRLSAPVFLCMRTVDMKVWRGRVWGGVGAR